MKEYKKPVACGYKMNRNIVPAALSSLASVAALSVGEAFAVGVAAGLASKGDIQGINTKCNNIKKVTAF